MVTGVIEETHDGPYMVTGATERHDMMTGVIEEIRQYPHMMTATQEEIPYCSPSTSSGKQTKALSTSQPHFRSENTLRQLKQTRFCWPFSSWRRTVILPMSITTVTKFQNCLSPSRQQCPPSTGNQRTLNCLKIYSKRVQKSTISSKKKTKNTISTLSCVVMRCRRPKTSEARTERI